MTSAVGFRCGSIGFPVLWAVRAVLPLADLPQQGIDTTEQPVAGGKTGGQFPQRGLVFSQILDERFGTSIMAFVDSPENICGCRHE